MAEEINVEETVIKGTVKNVRNLVSALEVCFRQEKWFSKAEINAIEILYDSLMDIKSN